MKQAEQNNEFFNNFDQDFINEIELDDFGYRSNFPSHDSIWDELDTSEDEWDFVLDSVADRLSIEHRSI